MSSISDLATSVAAAAGLPAIQLITMMRYLREAGLVATKGRGLAAAAMSTSDLAMVVVALLATDKVVNCVAATATAAASPLQEATLDAKIVIGGSIASGVPAPPASDTPTFGAGVHQLIILMTKPGIHLPQIIFDPDTLCGTITASISGHGYYRATFGPTENTRRFKGLMTLRSLGTDVLEAGLGSLARPISPRSLARQKRHKAAAL